MKGEACMCVRLSVYRVPRPKLLLDLRHERKGLGISQTWQDNQWTYLVVKRSKVRVTGSQLLAASTRYVHVYMRMEDIGTATLNSHVVPAWLFLFTPSYM